MADITLVKISALPAAEQIGAEDLLPVVQEGATKAVAYGVIKDDIANELAPDATLSEAGKAADAKAVGDALALKADKTELTAEVSRIDAALNTKVNNTTYTAEVERINGAIETKADAAETTAALATKANANAVTEALALKADKTEVNAGLALKADKTELTAGLATKQNKLTFDTAPTEGSTNPVTSGGVYNSTFKELGLLPNGTDLDTLTGKSGFYICGTSSVYPNQPINGGRRTLFLFSYPNSTYTVQVMIESRYNHTSQRVYASGAWSAWIATDTQELASAVDFEKKRHAGQNQALIAVSHGGVYTDSALMDTRQAFVNAYNEGLSYQDVDVVFSSDSVPVVTHDWQKTDIDGNTVTITASTYADILTHTFGTSDYSYNLESLADSWVLQKKLGMQIGIDIHGGTNNPAGSVEGFVEWLRLHNIKPIYIHTSTTAVFDKLVANNAADYPVGIVVSSQTDDIAGKLQKIIDAQASEKLIFFPAWTIAMLESLLGTNLQTLINAGVKICGYGYTESQMKTFTYPYYMSMILSQNGNVNYLQAKTI